jgi:hypothetical protein
MMKKLVLAALIILQLSIVPSWSAETVLIDRLTSSEPEELDIEIPATVSPGYHEVIIEISDDNGVVDKKVLTFCKDLDGRIDWASSCPNLIELASEEDLAGVEIRLELPAYDPALEPDKTSDLQVTAYAALAALTAGGAAAAARSGGSQPLGRRGEDEDREDSSANNDENQGDKEQDDLTSVSAGGLLLINRGPGRGDLSSTWRNAGHKSVERFFRALVRRISPHSPLIARTVDDASYLRAIFGSFSLLTMAPAIALGVLALVDTEGQALPPAFAIIVAIIALATFDAFAGLIAGSIFALGVALSGNIFSRDELLTVAGLFIIFYAPALLASAIRPLRRLASDRDLMWERTTDYALATLLSGWTMSKLVGALNGLAGLQLPITFKATEIAFWTAGVVLARMIIEDLATYLYPVRLQEVAGAMHKPPFIQKVIALELKIFIFVQLAMPFVGYNIQLLLGTILFALPTVVGFFLDDRLPKVKILHRILPTGAFKIVAMVFIGAIAAGWIQGMFTSPTKFLEWSFVVLAIPGLILGFLDKMSGEPAKDWKQTPLGNTFYRILGIIVFILIIQIVRGVDLYAAVFG